MSTDVELSAAKRAELLALAEHAATWLTATLPVSIEWEPGTGARYAVAIIPCEAFAYFGNSARTTNPWGSGETGWMIALPDYGSGYAVGSLSMDPHYCAEKFFGGNLADGTQLWILMDAIRRAIHRPR